MSQKETQHNIAITRYSEGKSKLEKLGNKVNNHT